MTNIIGEWKKRVDISEYEANRELAVWSKKEGLSLSEFASMYRRQNYLKKSGANEDQIESLIVNLMNGAKSVPEGKIVDLVNQLFEINI